MRVVRKYLLLAVLLVFYMAATAILLRSYYVYRNAYQRLSRLISHPSIETVYETEAGED